ncbi:MAG: MFS transporter [Phycisphaerae bacterium]|nr:MFS transporter [Phycisphaerae bacterium]
MADEPKAEERKNPLREITQPFIDLVHAPRALWGINLAYLIEGMVYFGMLSYLAMYFNNYIGLNDQQAGWMVGVLTGGITIAMFLLGGVADRWGVRFALVAAFVVMLGGRVLLAGAPYAGLGGSGLFSSIHLIAMGGILLVIIGYGMYQPAAYAGVRQFTSEKTAAMGFAMLYALMNLGGWLPTWFTGIRQSVGISGAYWVWVGFTAIALVATFIILSRKTVEKAIADAKAEREREEKEKAEQMARKEASPKEETASPQARFRRCVHPDCRASNPADAQHCGRCGRPLDDTEGEEVLGEKEATPKEATVPVAIPAEEERVGFWDKVYNWLVNHPLTDPKFAFFIFCLIPVQTLFAHNWLTLPMYVERGFRESWPWISINFEKAVNFNPLLIFILVPIVTAITQKRKVYNMMILGTLVMAAPTFLLAFGAEPWTLVAYLVIMTVGEAMWQPRFLQYAAEIAPEGRTGAYMGVAQFPWFLTKVIVPLYSGWFLTRYCPEEGPTNTGTMWLVYACIAMASTALLILARGWLGKDFKTKAD